MASRDFAVSVVLGQLGNYRAEAIEPASFLRQGDFDVCVVLVPLEAIAADIGTSASPTEDHAASLADFFACLDCLSDWFAGPIIVCNLPLPPIALRGAYNRKQSQSARYARGEANQLLAAHCEGRRNLTVCDLAWLAGGAGSTEFFSARNFATVLQPFSPAGFQLLADEWAELCQLHFRGPAKCIVLDCDNIAFGRHRRRRRRPRPPPGRDLSGRLLSAIPAAVERTQAVGLSCRSTARTMRLDVRNSLRGAPRHGAPLG